MGQIPVSPILFLERNLSNNIYIMRDDLLPFSFGGNKMRKALLFFEEINAGDFDTVVTYGSGGSNHCRIIANMAVAGQKECHIISTDHDSQSINRRIVEHFGARVHGCQVQQVAETIDRVMEELRRSGKKPYFIPGGGHGNIGTRALDLAYDQIREFSETHNIPFDYIFLASGTGTTQAGLLCGKMRSGADEQKIVGISIARKNPYGRNVIADSVLAYTGKTVDQELIFVDDYICGGYGKFDKRVEDTIKRILFQHGIPLDPHYTGKAYSGMEQYLEKNKIQGKNILFVHTGGTPLFCDWVRV